jgi:hypothetical protein
VDLHDLPEMFAARVLCREFHIADSYAWADRMRNYLGLRLHSSVRSLQRVQFVSTLNDILIDIPSRQEVDLKRLRIWAWLTMHAPSMLHGSSDSRFELLRHLLCIERLGTKGSQRLNLERFCMSAFVASSLIASVAPDMLLLFTASLIQIARSLSITDENGDMDDHGSLCFIVALQLYAEMARRCPAMWSHWSSAQDMSQSLGVEDRIATAYSLCESEPYKDAAYSLWDVMQKNIKSSDAGSADDGYVPLHVGARKPACGAEDAEKLGMTLQQCMLSSSSGHTVQPCYAR